MIFGRKHKEQPSSDELAGLAQRVRDVERVLIGWSVRGDGIENLNHLLGEVHRVLLKADDAYAHGWRDAMLQEHPPEATLSDNNPRSVVGVPWNEDGYAG